MSTIKKVPVKLRFRGNNTDTVICDFLLALKLRQFLKFLDY